MNTKVAKEGMWLWDGDSTFVRKVASFGDLSKWQDVTQEFKDKWDKEHPVIEPEQEGEL